MKKPDKNLTICMNCLQSVVTDVHDKCDPVGTRLVVIYSCNQCYNESPDDLQFYNYRMHKLARI